MRVQALLGMVEPSRPGRPVAQAPQKLLAPPGSKRFLGLNPLPTSQFHDIACARVKVARSKCLALVRFLSARSLSSSAGSGPRPSGSRTCGSLWCPGLIGSILPGMSSSNLCFAYGNHHINGFGPKVQNWLVGLHRNHISFSFAKLYSFYLKHASKLAMI